MRTFFLTFNNALNAQPAQLRVGNDSGLGNVCVSLLHENCDVDKTTGLVAVVGLGATDSRVKNQVSAKNAFGVEILATFHQACSLEWWGKEGKMKKQNRQNLNCPTPRKKALGIKVKVNLRHLRLPPLYK